MISPSIRKVKLLPSTFENALIGIVKISSRGELLNYLVKDESLELLITILNNVNSDDKVASALVYAFSKEKPLVLFRTAVDIHINNLSEGDENEVFRNNSTPMKVINIIYKDVAQHFLVLALKNPMERFLNDTKANYEIDPSKIGFSKDEKNMMALEAAALDFIESIFNHSSSAPSMLRELCQYVREVVASKFPSHVDIAVGSLLFLRLLCPAIVAPKSHGLSMKAPTRDQLRGLTLIAKILQSLTSGIPFKEKEPYFAPLNPFVNSLKKHLEAFYLEIGTLKEDIALLTIDPSLSLSSPTHTSHAHSSPFSSSSLLSLDEGSKSRSNSFENNGTSENLVETDLSVHTTTNAKKSNNLDFVEVLKNYIEKFSSQLAAQYADNFSLLGGGLSSHSSSHSSRMHSGSKNSRRSSNNKNHNNSSRNSATNFSLSSLMKINYSSGVSLTSNGSKQASFSGGISENGGVDIPSLHEDSESIPALNAFQLMGSAVHGDCQLLKAWYSISSNDGIYKLLRLAEGADDSAIDESSKFEFLKNDGGIRISSYKDNGKNGLVTHRGYGVIEAPPNAIFELLKNNERRSTWNKTCENLTLVEKINFHMDVIYYVQKYSTISSVINDRDFCCLRTSVRDAVGKNTFVILEQSLEREDVPPVIGYVRGSIFVSGFYIEPDKTNKLHSRVTYLEQGDLKGWLTGLLSKQLTSNSVSLLLNINSALEKAQNVTKSTDTMESEKNIY